MLARITLLDWLGRSRRQSHHFGRIRDRSGVIERPPLSSQRRSARGKAAERHHPSPIPPIEYPWIYHERVIRSVANSTRQDARELLRDAAVVPVVSRVQEYDLEQANEALLDLKEDRVRGSAVLRVAVV